MKPLTEAQASDLADNLETLSGNLSTIADLLRDFDADDRKASTRVVCEAINEDDLMGEEWLKAALSMLRRMLKAHDDGDFDGMDGSTMGAAVAAEALWSVALDPSLAYWADGEGTVDLANIDFSEVNDVPDMGGVEATITLDGRKIALTFDDDEWGTCEASGTLDEDDERLPALRAAIEGGDA